jgi:hypothetical protein
VVSVDDVARKCEELGLKSKVRSCEDTIPTASLKPRRTIS